MLEYLKNRFKEYVSYGKSKDIAITWNNQMRTKDSYVNFEITYDQTDFVIDTFSMTQEEVCKDFAYFIKQNLADVLEIDKGSIHLVSKVDDSFYFDIDYSGKLQYIRHKVTKLPNASHKSEEIVYNDIGEDYNPYTDGAWADSSWHCICCGKMLSPIAEFDKWWGNRAWDAMRRDGTQWFICMNENCCHSSSPLILHHPCVDGCSPASDSYSISYIK
jgi:hypothetical protein